MGLVDEIGDIRATLKARYGEKTKLKLVEAKKSLLGNRVASGVSLSAGLLDSEALSAGMADGLISAAEEKMLWNRLGL